MTSSLVVFDFNNHFNVMQLILTIFNNTKTSAGYNFLILLNQFENNAKASYNYFA